ncbi:Transposase and inactivated derivatives, partial [Lachnospiraceae bacterium XBB1006]
MSKYTVDIIIAACEDYISSNLSHREICQKYGIYYNDKNHNSMLNKWIRRYRAQGESAFLKEKGNKKYTSQQKKAIVEEYLDGKGSYKDIAAKYGIPSE